MCDGVSAQSVCFIPARLTVHVCGSVSKFVDFPVYNLGFLSTLVPPDTHFPSPVQDKPLPAATAGSVLQEEVCRADS